MENLFENKKEPVKGEGFIMREETAEEKHISKQIEIGNRIKAEIEADPRRLKNEMLWELANEFKNDFKISENFSETLHIKSDGTLDYIRMGDIMPALFVVISDVKTVNEFYEVVKKFTEIYPEYKFNFETDPEGKWIKYSVSKADK